MSIVENITIFRIDILITIFASVSATILARRILERRITLKYNVQHSQIGLSAKDPVFGDIKIVWNETPLTSLYLSTMEIRNTSMRDIENLVLKVIPGENTNLLNEKTHLSDSADFFDYTEDYKENYIPPLGEEATEYQIERRLKHREYLIPSLNRGQTAKLEFLTNALVNEANRTNPTIFASVQSKGVKLKYSETPVLSQTIFSIPIPYAAWTGIFISTLLTISFSQAIEDTNLKIILALGFGLGASVFGAIVLLFLKKAKELVAG